MPVTLGAIKPYYEETDYTSFTDEFLQHFQNAVTLDFYNRMGSSHILNVELNRVKCNLFRITINGHIKRLKIDKWYPLKENYDDWKNRNLVEYKRQSSILLKEAKLAFQETEIGSFNDVIELIPQNNIEKILSLQEIHRLLFRINSSYARSIYRKWNIHDKEIINEAERLAKITIDKYGIHVVKYILSLPITNAYDVDLKLYQTTYKNDVPLNNIQIRLDNDEHIIINFQLLTDRRERKSAFVFSKKNGNDVKLIGTLNQNGELKTNRKYFNPRLLVVINQRENILYGGLNPRCCIDCGRELTVPESILLGIGPECYQKYGYWSAYSLNFENSIKR
jgi:hypothetical protein